jgi:parvulin-like peptidyl-prolyl isomerase
MRIPVVLMLTPLLVPAAEVLVIDQIVAKVNGDIITSKELERTQRQMIEEATQRGMKPEQIAAMVKDRGKDILRDRIDQLLLVQKAKELNINVDQQFSKYQADMMKQLKIAEQEKFAEMVREQTGQSYEDWRSETKSVMMTQAVMGREVQSKITVPKSELLKYYEEHKSDFVRQEQVFLQEIFLKFDGGNEAAVEKKAKDLVARAKKGERFSDLARDNSDSESAQSGGDLGGFKKGELDPAIEKMVFEGGKNFVTDPPIRRSNGFLILKVLDVHAAGQATFEQVENEVMEKVYVPKMAPAMRAYLTQLRQEAFLEIRDGWVDTGAAPGKNTEWTDPAQLKPETITKEELANQKRLKRLLGIPVPGTSFSIAGEEAKRLRAAEEPKGVSSSKELKAK